MNTPPTATSPKAQLRANRVLFIALIAGLLFMSVILIAMSLLDGPPPPDKDLETIFLGVGIAISLPALFVARRLYSSRIAVAKDSLNSLTDKLNQYRAALIIYMALCEGPALFSIIVFFITGNYYMFIITAIMLAAMLTKAPTKQRVVEELGLGSQEEQEL